MVSGVGIVLIIVVIAVGYMYVRAHTKKPTPEGAITPQRLDDTVGGLSFGYMIGSCEDECKDTNSSACDKCLRNAAGSMT